MLLLFIGFILVIIAHLISYMPSKLNIESKDDLEDDESLPKWYKGDDIGGEFASLFESVEQPDDSYKNAQIELMKKEFYRPPYPFDTSYKPVHWTERWGSRDVDRGFPIWKQPPISELSSEA